MILQVLRDVADNGLPQEQVAASLHQLELSQREYLAVATLRPASDIDQPYQCHASRRSSVLLNLDPVLEKLQQQITIQSLLSLWPVTCCSTTSTAPDLV